MTPELEERLVNEARRGNRDAFEELLRATWRMVMAAVIVETGDYHRAADIVQDTLLAAVRGLGDLRESRGFRAWLMAIARNVVASQARHEAAIKRGGGSQPHGGAAVAARGHADRPDPAGDPAHAVEAAERHQAIRQAVMAGIERLPAEYRMVVTMRYVMGADHATMRDQLGLSDGALRGLLARGTRLLRADVSRSLGLLEAPVPAPNAAVASNP